MQQGEMAVMGREGDTKIMWSRDNPVEVDNARAAFAKFKKEGFAAFKCRGKDGERGEQVDEFDPAAERYIFVPPMRGG